MEWQQRAGTVLDARAVEEGFRGPQVCKIVGITYRQLDYWARTDLLRPSISDARGSGTQRIYSYTDLVGLRTIKQLLEEGVSLRSTRKALECLRASGADLGSATLVIAGERSVLAHSGDELFDLLRGGQGVLSMVLGMDRIVSEVDAAITELSQSQEGGGQEGTPPPASEPGLGSANAAGLEGRARRRL
ncbi:MAG TPA: MerR family transcriptional regulator [Acidimicrobiales bacterium]|nr:MerR family transcriptional regulator [Acidimicrobiales bacterium]